MNVTTRRKQCSLVCCCLRKAPRQKWCRNSKTMITMTGWCETMSCWSLLAAECRDYDIIVPRSMHLLKTKRSRFYAVRILFPPEIESAGFFVCTNCWPWPLPPGCSPDTNDWRNEWPRYSRNSLWLYMPDFGMLNGNGHVCRQATKLPLTWCRVASQKNFSCCLSFFFGYSGLCSSHSWLERCFVNGAFGMFESVAVGIPDGELLGLVCIWVLHPWSIHLGNEFARPRLEFLVESRGYQIAICGI